MPRHEEKWLLCVFVSVSVCKSLRSWPAPFHLAAWLGDIARSCQEAEVGIQVHPLTWTLFLEDSILQALNRGWIWKGKDNNSSVNISSSLTKDSLYLFCNTDRDNFSMAHDSRAKLVGMYTFHHLVLLSMLLRKTSTGPTFHIPSLLDI